jgi:hypothetical protein
MLENPMLTLMRVPGKALRACCLNISLDFATCRH